VFKMSKEVGTASLLPLGVFLKQKQEFEDTPKGWINEYDR